MDKKLADLLWTTRWAITNNKKEAAYEEVTKALVHIGAEGPVEVDRPSVTPPKVESPKFEEPNFVVVKGVKFKNQKNYNTASKQFEGLVVHYTVSGRTASSAKAVLNWLASKNLGCMVMDENGLIYIPEGFDIFKHYSSHAGVSKWGNRSSMSQYFAGMEICCWGLEQGKGGTYRKVTTKQGYVVAGNYQAFTEAQEKSLVNFILWAKSKNPNFNLDNVVGHDELRREAGKLGDKADAGGSLSMPMPEFRKFIKDKWGK